MLIHDPGQVLDEHNISIIDDFVSLEECAAILNELRFTLWGQSSVVKYNGDEDSPAYYDQMRKSQTAGQIWFSEELNQRLAIIEFKLANTLKNSVDHFEEWQASQYFEGDQFDYHVDCGNWGKSLAGERKRTFLLYLDTPAEGGETNFRAFNKIVKAKAGRLVIWNNLLPSGKCNFGMIHAGLPVAKGIKTILVSWERERVYRSV